VIPYLFYRDVPAALEWLARAFGFVEELRHGTESGMDAQMTLDGQRIMVGQGSSDWRMQSPSETKIATMGIFVYLADVDAHFERARQAGAEIVQALHDEPMDAPIRRGTSTDIPGSSPRHPASPRAKMLVIRKTKREIVVTVTVRAARAAAIYRGR